MENFTTSTLEWFTALPLHWFVFLGAIIEEILVIIPSPFIGITAGTLLKNQGLVSIEKVVMLSLLGGVGKSCGALIFYFLADKGEDLLFRSRLSRFIGVSHKQVEGIGRLMGKDRRAELVFLLLRAIPLIPSAPVSVFAGGVRFPLKVFLVLTFIGFSIRSMMLIWLGSHTNNIDELFAQLDQYGSFVKWALVALVAVAAILLYRKRNKLFEHHTPLQPPKV